MAYAIVGLDAGEEVGDVAAMLKRGVASTGGRTSESCGEMRMADELREGLGDGSGTTGRTEMVERMAPEGRGRTGRPERVCGRTGPGMVS